MAVIGDNACNEKKLTIRVSDISNNLRKVIQSGNGNVNENNLLPNPSTSNTPVYKHDSVEAEEDVVSLPLIATPL